MLPYEPTQGQWVKVLTQTQILQKLLILLAQVQAGNTSEHLLNEIAWIVHSLYREKQIYSLMHTGLGLISQIG